MGTDCTVPEADVRRRFDAGLRNFVSLYRPLTDNWWLYNAIEFPSVLTAREEGGQRTVQDADLFEQIAADLGGGAFV